MKIEYYKYGKAETLDYINRHYNMFRRTFPITDQSTITAITSLTAEELGSFHENGEPHRRLGCLFDGSARKSGVPILSLNTNSAVYFNCALFVNHENLFSGSAVFPELHFTYCIFDNVSFSSTKHYGSMYFDGCILLNCTMDDEFQFIMNNCITDKKYGNANSSYTNCMIGNPMFISKDANDLWDKDTNPQGVGYCRMAKWRGYDYDVPIQSAGICGIADNHQITPTPYTWTPAYACNESKKIVLFNNQDYIDLDGERRNYYEKALTEITLDFTKNGLTQEDMAAVKDIYENSDNEITIYPNEDDVSNYIVGRLSKSDFDYSKMINSYWDNGKIDNERFNGVRMVIRVTDDSHFTRSV